MDRFVVKRPNFVASYAASSDRQWLRRRLGREILPPIRGRNSVYYDDDLNNVHWLISVLFYVLQNIEWQTAFQSRGGPKISPYRKCPLFCFVCARSINCRTKKSSVLELNSIIHYAIICRRADKSIISRETKYIHVIMKVTGYNKTLYFCRNIPQFLTFLPQPYRNFCQNDGCDTATFSEKNRDKSSSLTSTVLLDVF